MIHTIETTEANASVTASDAYDELAATMHEVHKHVATARTLIHAAMIETPGPIGSPIFEALAKASSSLWFALTAWEPDQEARPDTWNELEARAMDGDIDADEWDSIELAAMDGAIFGDDLKVSCPHGNPSNFACDACMNAWTLSPDDVPF